MNAITQTENKVRSTKDVVIAMLFVGLLFFVLGFVTWLNGSLIPFLKIVCNLNNFQALWVTFAFYIACIFTALPSANIIGRVGYKNGMVIGLGIMAIGALLFIPAARSTYYGLFLLALFTLSAGMTLMQTAINPYIVCIGSRESAAMRISIMGLFNKGAGVVVPLVFTAFILSGMSAYSDSALALLDQAGKDALRAELSLRLVFPYTIMAGALLLIMMVVYFSSFQDIAAEKDETDQTVTKFGVLQYPQLVLGALALFTYVGVEVIAGDTIGLYGHSLGVQKFGILTSYTMGCMVLGYLLGVVAIPKFLLQKHALLLSAVCGLIFTLGVVLSSPTNTNISELLVGWAGVPAVPNTVMFLAMLGFANALVWPSIWPLALEGLGKYTASGSALLVMGIAGGAVLPLLYGKISDVTSSQAAYWVMIPAYAFILFYSIKGHTLKSWK